MFYRLSCVFGGGGLSTKPRGFNENFVVMIFREVTHARSHYHKPVARSEMKEYQKPKGREKDAKRALTELIGLSL